MAAFTLFLQLTFAATSFPVYTEASKKFLVDDSKIHINGQTFQEDIMNAMGSMLGCGGQASPEQMGAIRMMLHPMWQTLPKASKGRIDRRSLRYLVHRYFMQTSSLMIRGFEPTRPVNDSYWGVADILSQAVPAYVEDVLESRHIKEHGFAFDDAVSLVVMLEQLIFDAESTLLEKVYKDQGTTARQSLSHDSLRQVLEAYIVEWMVAGDPADIAMLLGNKTLLAEVVPHYHSIVQFLDGRMKTLRYTHHQKVPKGRGRDTWDNKYSFQDAHEIVGGITRSFQTYWQSECTSMKDALVAMDIQKTGRVPLAKFYGTAINTDWRFGESEAYLRELGALDESSTWLGPQVIIPNYVQATSNCIVSTPHYLVCCVNECETLLGEIELGIGAPTASPAAILEIVGNMTSQTTLDDDDLPTFLPEDMLTLQLQRVAASNGGNIPLHGRLFAQWLHYVFPRECSFPHKIGVVSAVTPSEFGEDYMAKNEDMKRHAANTTASTIAVTVKKDELQWMSQWSPEEEHFVDYWRELGMTWQQRVLIVVGGLLLIGLALWGGIIHGGKQSSGPSSMAGKVAWV